ncbi:GNAT family N-acetyltransferase [Aldersonia sp. NBC_00410]|uniref:GNAT family N-acetyltransferase n=1 Tax=Aldersonia sp. NBC_00410 TaxID=2975954 RepID=UPI0022537224|nr:GNAT family N-acetyltransferase [Aldersonia sp. NBC_00410]MCX5046103.1 GNAT family N-acetyltransferase [Aldersonia sp. NBC_00410]
MDNVIIRAASPEQYDEIGALTVEVYVDGGFIPETSPYAAELGDTANRAASADILVAELDGRIVGSVTVARPGTIYARLAAPDEIEFRMLAVDKSVRGRGVGTTLVRHVLALAAAEGFRGVVITTMDQMVDARRIYERLGFVRVPERDSEVAPGFVLPTLEYRFS